MNLQMLQYFRHTAHTGNLTKAAQDLHIAQPALSIQISRLEKEVGGKLFERTGRGVRLTDAGRILLFHCDRILQEWGHATQGIQELIHGGKANIKLAVYPTFLWYVLPLFLSSFIKDHPMIRLEIEHGLTETIAEWVLSNQMEAGVVTAPYSHPQLKTVPIFTEQFVLIVPFGHPWFNRRELHFSELHEKPLIVSTVNRWYEHFMLPVFRQHNIQPKIELVVHHYDVIKELVRTRTGISLVPLNAYTYWCNKEPALPQEMAAVQVKPTLQRQLLWVERHDHARSQACEQFFDCLSKTIDSLDLII